jgi:hypothetical protein
MFIGEALSQTLLRNIAETGRLAVQASNPVDHRTLQLKGRTVRAGLAPDSDREFVAGFVHELAQVVDCLGMPYDRVVRMTHWPAIVVDVRVEEIFLQTPGPGAGAPLAGRSP